MCLTETIKRSIDHGRIGCGVFLGLQKAFDTAKHEISLQNLEHYGIRSNVLSWFQSYLTGRSHYVSVNGHVSTTLPITCGVPEGSVLGPLLFLIYVNGLASVSKVLKFCLVADDTSIYFDSDDLFTLQKVVNRELKNIKKWSDANRLSLNIAKTNFVIFHSKPINFNELIRIKFGSKLLTRVESIKHPGILVDSTLTWKPQISELSKKLARTCSIFFRMRHYVTPETLKLLYYSLLYLFLSYDIVVWGSTHLTILDHLFKVLQRVIHAISFKNRATHTTPLFYELRMLTLHDIHSLKLLCFV